MTCLVVFHRGVAVLTDHLARLWTCEYARLSRFLQQRTGLESDLLCYSNRLWTCKHCVAYCRLSCDCPECNAEAFVYDVEEDKLNEAGVRAAVWDEMTIYHPEALNLKRL